MLGSLDVDPDFFSDDDDLQHGDGADYIDWEKDWRFGEFPEGFTWTCCDQRGDEGPCVVSKHVATGSGNGGVIDLVSSNDEENEDEDEEDDDGY